MTEHETHILDVILKSDIILTENFQKAFMEIEKLRIIEYNLSDVFLNLITFYWVKEEKLCVPLSANEKKIMAAIFKIVS